MLLYKHLNIIGDNSTSVNNANIEWMNSQHIPRDPWAWQWIHTVVFILERDIFLYYIYCKTKTF